VKKAAKRDKSCMANLKKLATFCNTQGQEKEEKLQKARKARKAKNVSYEMRDQARDLTGLQKLKM